MSNQAAIIELKRVHARLISEIDVITKSIEILGGSMADEPPITAAPLAVEPMQARRKRMTKAAATVLEKPRAQPVKPRAVATSEQGRYLDDLLWSLRKVLPNPGDEIACRSIMNGRDMAAMRAYCKRRGDQAEFEYIKNGAGRAAKPLIRRTDVDANAARGRAAAARRTRRDEPVDGPAEDPSEPDPVELRARLESAMAACNGDGEIAIKDHFEKREIGAIRKLCTADSPWEYHQGNRFQPSRITLRRADAGHAASVGVIYDENDDEVSEHDLVEAQVVTTSPKATVVQAPIVMSAPRPPSVYRPREDDGQILRRMIEAMPEVDDRISLVDMFPDPQVRDRAQTLALKDRRFVTISNGLGVKRVEI